MERDRQGCYYVFHLNSHSIVTCDGEGGEGWERRDEKGPSAAPVPLPSASPGEGKRREGRDRGRREEMGKERKGKRKQFEEMMMKRENVISCDVE